MGWLHEFRLQPGPCSGRGEGLRGDDVDLIQVILGKVLIISKRVINSHCGCYVVVQASEAFSGWAVHPVTEKEEKN